MDRLQQALELLRAESHPALAKIHQDPANLFLLAGMTPDPWQTSLLSSNSTRMLLLCSRQSGKSTVAAALAVKAALLEAPALVLLLSPTLRQSGELFRDKILTFYNRLGRPVRVTQESALQMTLANGSRIISLPGDEETIRGYSGVRLLIVDEAGRVHDALYYAIRPMRAISQGRMICLSTPWGRRGWFFETWHGKEEWQRVRIPAQECPRISKEFLREERLAIGERWFEQEYECRFLDTINSVFNYEDIMAAVANDYPAAFTYEEVLENVRARREAKARSGSGPGPGH
jgi:hypothetical protein